ncbi:MATE family efflux transporter [Nitrospirillum pindoramense]|uniref:Multidrug-efflux transporter n=1 Tax=Nitrospirillum amazonense TaxID=28077 RepID=A0A560HBK7_9PROT|nr:MATE family efflux transporter [Nitrospirillum amazonense]TWB43747.1 MATE family multidrug resistance protein [Nitrospirillum amazonense]
MTQFEPPVPPEVSAAVTPLPPLDEAAVEAACPGLPPRGPDEALLPRVLVHARDLVLLAAPLMLTRIGQLFMQTVDTAMVGRYSAEELAYFGLGNTPVGTAFATVVGLMMGTIILVAQAVGAGRPHEAGAVWRRSLPYALLIGGIVAIACQFGEAFFLLTGQEADIAHGAAAVIAILGLGMPAAVMQITTSFFLEGIKRPFPAMISMIVANLLNFALDYTLVFGHFGLPALGAMGSAIATTSIRWITALGLILYVWTMRDHARYGVRGSFLEWRQGRGHRHLGYAAGLSQGAESSAFGTMGIFAGWLGALGLGAYAVGLNVLALVFMAALGLASATAVQVGQAHGAGNRREATLAGWTGLAITALTLAVVGVVLALAPEIIAGLYASDPALIRVLVPTIALMAWIVVADGGQTVMASALRGQGDSWIPTALHFFSYYGVMIPTAAYAAFHLGHGILGIFEGILAASIVAVSVLMIRFHLLSRR